MFELAKPEFLLIKLNINTYWEVHATCLRQNATIIRD